MACGEPPWNRVFIRCFDRGFLSSTRHDSEISLMWEKIILPRYKKCAIILPWYLSNHEGKRSKKKPRRKLYIPRGTSTHVRTVTLLKIPIKKGGAFCNAKKTRLFCVVKFRVFETTRKKENPSRIEKWNPGKKGIKISISWWIFLTTRGAGIHKEIRRMIFQNPRFQKTK